MSKKELEMTQEKLFTLYHGNENNKEIVVNNIKDWEQLWKEIPKFLKKKNFKSRYYRQWIIKDVLYIDYGS